MNRRGKIIALLTVAVGLVVLVAAGYVAKDRIREERYLLLPAVALDLEVSGPVRRS